MRKHEDINRTVPDSNIEIPVYELIPEDVRKTMFSDHESRIILMESWAKRIKRSDLPESQDSDL